MAHERTPEPGLVALTRRLAQLERRLEQERARLRAASGSLQQRLHNSAGWLLPIGGLTTGLVLAQRRTRGAFAVGLSLWRLLAGPFTALLGWLGPLAAAHADAAAPSADVTGAAADPASVAEPPATNPTAAAARH